ncbi:hypothetical protein [Paracraurococcus lichenis]|uniref:Uncharacterized protein n=1 Tax=Paracraurococcus lichenis TaxID=3064888 RepID=A0ABT9E908_9PROT|nr:hypothetical protein [Paracraurococcus sp. LOR1-02]MDO9712686.1 hypothetical protein [Paracraurococcus sp. LOR1-02]
MKAKGSLRRFENGEHTAGSTEMKQATAASRDGRGSKPGHIGSWIGAAEVGDVGIDVYDDDLHLGGDRGLRHYAALVATGKPFGMTEFGQYYDVTVTGLGAASWDARTLAARVRDSYPRTALAAAWYSSVQNAASYVLALADVAHAKELFEDPLVETQ